MRLGHLSVHILDDNSTRWHYLHFVLKAGLRIAGLCPHALQQHDLVGPSFKSLLAEATCLIAESRIKITN
jgi:hypothetical protein